MHFCFVAEPAKPANPLKNKIIIGSGKGLVCCLMAVRFIPMMSGEMIVSTQPRFPESQNKLAKKITVYVL